MKASDSLENLVLHFIHRAELMRREFDVRRNHNNNRLSVLAEVKSLEFWRAIISECMASFFYVFLSCGVFIVWPQHVALNVWVQALASGFAMATVIQCFGHASAAFANPACTLTMLATRKITLLRTFLYITSQCGGAIAGAALLYGVTVTSKGHSSQSLGCNEVHPSLAAWQAVCLELVLTFVVVFTMFAASDPNRNTFSHEAFSVGSAYLVCSLIALPATGASMNPARTLGPAFVTNKWANHWVYWCGPLCGGLLGGLIYEYIFHNTKRSASKPSFDDEDGDSIDEEVYVKNDSEPIAKFAKTSLELHTQPTIRLTQQCDPQIYNPTLDQQHHPRSNCDKKLMWSRGSSSPAISRYVGEQSRYASQSDSYSSLPRNLTHHSKRTGESRIAKF